MVERALTVSIIVPTRNEEGNIKALLSKLLPYGHEVVVVDDSVDATAAIALEMGARVIKGKGEGLGQAIIDGINHSNSDVVLVMDADLSHSPESVPDLLEPIIERGYDMTIGSRYVKGGSIKGWTAKRMLISKVASLMAYPITWFRDNTSGFFAVRKSVLGKLRADSWKIMLEILIRSNPTAVMEVPICFTDRTVGKSKFTSKEVFRYLAHLLRLGLHKYRALIKFGIIGLSGAGIHFLALYTLTDILNIWYLLSAVLAVILASTSNYIWNHRFTFGDRSISNHLIGWLKYQVMSGITDSLYLGILVLFVEVFGFWYMAGAFFSALIIFPVKFAVASSMIWSKKLHHSQADYEWNAFFNGSIVQKWWKQQIAETVWKWIPESDRLLDYGCGSSPIITKYKNAVGCDINKDKLDYMRLKCPTVNFVNGTLDKMSQFTDVICIEVLEHIETPHALMGLFSNMIPKGGRLVIATPDYNKLLWHVAEQFTPYKEEHITRYTRNSLESLCEGYGFRPVEHKYVAWCDLCELFVRE